MIAEIIGYVVIAGAAAAVLGAIFWNRGTPRKLRCNRSIRRKK